MEQTYIANATTRVCSAFAENSPTGAGDLLNLFNPANSSRAVRVYQIFLPTSSTADASAPQRIQIVRTKSAVGGLPANVETFSGDNALLDGLTSFSYSSSLATDGVLRSFLLLNAAVFSTSRLGGGALTKIPYSIIWDAGYANADIQPLTCPLGRACGYAIISLDAQNGGGINPMMIFTSEAT